MACESVYMCMCIAVIVTQVTYAHNIHVYTAYELAISCSSIAVVNNSS